MHSSPSASEFRVAHVIRTISIEGAGTSYSVPALCSALASERVDVELHVVGDTKQRAAPTPHELHVHRPSTWLGPLDGSLAMRRALLRRGSEVDLFHSHGLWRLPGLYAARSARRSRKLLVIAPRGMLEPSALEYSRLQKNVFWRLGQGSAILGADCLHATSPGELESIRKLGLKNPVAVVTNAIHISTRPPTIREDGVRTLLYLGRLHPIKALDRLVEAWAQVEARHPEWVLRLVGPSEIGYSAQLNAQVAALGAKRVSFGPEAYGAEKEREFAAAQLFVLPSHSENFGMTVAEAFAQGVPVLASRGTPWAGIEAHGCGMWVDNSPKSLAAALDHLLGLPRQQLTAMGARGRAWMERDFSWSQKAQQLLEVYRWLLDPARARPESVDVVNGAARTGNRLLGVQRPPW